MFRTTKYSDNGGWVSIEVYTASKWQAEWWIGNDLEGTDCSHFVKFCEVRLHSPYSCLHLTWYYFRIHFSHNTQRTRTSIFLWVMAYNVIQNIFRQTGTSDVRLYNSERQTEAFYGTTLSVTKTRGRDSWVGISNMLRAGATGRFSCKPSRPTLGVTKPNVLKSFPGKQSGQRCEVPRLRKSGTIPLLSLYVFMTWTWTTSPFTSC